MAGSYGINKAADFIPTTHAEVLVSYTENRSSQGHHRGKGAGRRVTARRQGIGQDARGDLP